MKTKAEINTLTEEVEALGKKLAELSEEELAQVAGGMKVVVEEESSWFQTIIDFIFKIKP